MKHLWTRIGCFLTGYSYEILSNSSEASRKTVKKFLSAILIMSFLWGFIGFNFAKSYLHSDNLIAWIVAVVMVLMVIQIERQIILSHGKNRWVILFRVLIGVVMAVIGSVIIDQIIFKDDIEKRQITNRQIEVNEILPQKTRDLDLQIRQIDSIITLKEAERADVIAEVAAKPFIKSATTATRHINTEYTNAGGVVKDTVIRRTDLTLTDVANPKADLIPALDAQINELRNQKASKESSRINIRKETEDELKSKTGFLDELQVMFSILLSSGISLFVWTMFFLFFMSLELFVLVNKFGEIKTDYDLVITHQMDTRMNRINQLGEVKP